MVRAASTIRMMKPMNITLRTCITLLTLVGWAAVGVAFVDCHGTSSAALLSRAALSNRARFDGQQA